MKVTWMKMSGELVLDKQHTMIGSECWSVVDANQMYSADHGTDQMYNADHGTDQMYNADHGVLSVNLLSLQMTWHLSYEPWV